MHSDIRRDIPVLNGSDLWRGSDERCGYGFDRIYSWREHMVMGYGSRERRCLLVLVRAHLLSRLGRFAEFL